MNTVIYVDGETITVSEARRKFIEKNLAEEINKNLEERKKTSYQDFSEQMR